MKNPNLNQELVTQILDKTISQQKPSLVGNTTDWGIFLATYENFHDCYVPEHHAPFHVLEIIDESPRIPHQRILGDRKVESILKGGEVSIYPAHANYFFDSSGGDQHKGISFTLVGLDPNLVEELSREEFGCSRELTPQFLVSDTQKMKRIKYLIDLVKHEMINGYSESNFFLRDIRNELIRCLLGKSENPEEFLSKKRIPSLGNNWTQLIKELLNENLHRNTLLEEMAKYVNFSESYISRSFKQIEGINIKTYLHRIRVDRAQELLADETLSITEIAQKCGFSDASELNKRFKALMRITPSQFREQL